MTLTMAIMDFIPVILFLMASMTLLHDLYHMMSKGAFALLASGLIMISTAGFFKATWKLLYALNICDFTALNNCFFPMQSSGFLIGAIGITALLFFRQKSTVYAIAPAVYSSSMLFVVFTILGTAGIWGSMAYIAKKMGKTKTALVFVLSFICMLMMGYLSSRDFSDPKMNWIGEIVNVIGMTMLWAGIRSLHRDGLETFEMKR